MLNAGLLTAAIVALAAIAGQNTKDVRGWHGAEWGMNAEQLKGAVGMTLEPTTDGSVAECKTGTPGSTLFRATTAITVGTVSGSPKFCVTKRDGLVYIHMDFGAHAVDFSRIRGELIRTYGMPTSEKVASPFASVVTNTANWMLPKTQIRLLSFQSPELTSLSVTYLRRKPVL